MPGTWTAALRAHLGSGHVAHVVYGAIIGLALGGRLRRTRRPRARWPRRCSRRWRSGSPSSTAVTAFTIAKWSGLGLIAFYGYCAGRLSGAGNRSAVLQALAVGLIAAVLIALKALVH